jgi:hypothetical protein
MMMEMVRTHNSTAVKRGYLMFIIIFLMPHDRNFHQVLIRYRHRVVCHINVLPYIRDFMQNLVFLIRASAALVPVS